MDINTVNKEGRSALHACYANATHVKLLLAAGADPTIREKRHPHSPFLHAVYNGWVGATKGYVCMNRGARID